MCEKADKNGRMRKMCEKLRYIAEIQSKRKINPRLPHK